MFDRVGSLAERVATDVSRRAFLGSLGQGALGLAAVLGGLLAIPGQARASGGYCFGSGRGSDRRGYTPCWIYPAVNETCPCGGVLVKSPVNRCSLVSC